MSLTDELTSDHEIPHPQTKHPSCTYAHPPDETSIEEQPLSSCGLPSINTMMSHDANIPSGQSLSITTTIITTLYQRTTIMDFGRAPADMCTSAHNQ